MESQHDAQGQGLRQTFSGDLMRLLHASRPYRETRLEADHIIDLLAIKEGARLLDVPCGPGRIALELASRGFQVAGIDLSEEEVALSTQKATDAQLTGSVTFYAGDMRQLPWQDAFDAAYCYWESFGYFDDEGNQRFLDSAARALKPGGKLLIDTHIAESLFHHAPSKHWNWLDQTIWLEEWRYDLETGRLVRHWIFIQEDRITQRELAIQIYTYRELKRMCQAAGFVGFEPYTSLSRRPFNPGKERLNLVAIRG